ncbi:MAG: TRAP transporter small permease [Clostridia bacterium]|nr:TRAP transporter small permease [Clostridia bacterium]
MKYYDKIENFLIMVVLATMGIVLAYQVFMRYVVNQPVIWSEELARYLFVWFTYIGASYGVKRKAHIRLEFLHKQLSKKAQAIINILSNLLMIVVFLYLVPPGIDAVKYQHQLLSSAMEIPLSLIFIAVPIGLMIVSIRLLMDMIEELKKLIGGEV